MHGPNEKLLQLSIKFHQNSSHGSKVTASQTDKLSTFSSLQLLIDGHIQACVLQQMQDDLINAFNPES